MADLRIPSEILLAGLFPDRPSLILRNVRFDAARGLVVLDLAGPDIPETGEIMAIITVQSRVTSFEPVAPV